MLLMNGNRVVLQYDLDDLYIEVLDNQFLPYSLRDCISTSDFSDKEKMKKSMKDIDRLKDFLSGRTINLSRDNAKAILNSLSFGQSLKTSARIKIVTACQALSITDNFWIKDESSNQTFEDVNLRHNKLSEVAYNICMLGESISVSKDILQPDLGTDGMFRKTWHRNEDCIELWKSDRTSNCINTLSELQVSTILDYSNVRHVQYRRMDRDNLVIAVCDCIVDDDTSLINALDLSDWCNHTGKSFIKFLENNFLEDFSKMCVIDYVIANTDRHLGNIHFLVDNKTNNIKSMAPLLDHNQALITDEFNTDMSDLIYDVTEMTMLDSAVKYYKYSNFQINESVLPLKCLERLNKVRDVSGASEISVF